MHDGCKEVLKVEAWKLGLLEMDGVVLSLR